MESAKSVLAERLRVQEAMCQELGASFTAALLRAAAVDVLDGGPLAEVLAGHENDPGPSALGLRLVGALHRLVLSGSVPDLAATYPSDTSAGDARAAAALLPGAAAQHLAALRADLGAAPQTNEVGRAAPLWGALLRLLAEGAGDAAAREDGVVPVRIHEVGSSGGLLLDADRVRYEARDGASWGPSSSPVRLAGAWDRAPWAWAPGPAPDVEVVGRDGVDPSPLDPRDPRDALRLASFVWPEQRQRMGRLRGALELARTSSARVRRAGAADLAAGLTTVEGAVTVVWHSVVLQYLTAADRDALDAGLGRVGAGATASSPLVRLSLEPERSPRGDNRFVVAARVWGTGDPVRRLLGEAHPHGVPVTWWRRDPRW